MEPCGLIHATRRLLAGALAGATALICSCATSIPTMTFQHTEALPDRYDPIGTLTVGEMEDKRPIEERTTGGKMGDAVLGAPYVWSGSTEPSMTVFLRRAILQEAERTGILREADPGEFELTGSVASLRVTRRKTWLSYAFLVPPLLFAERPIYEAVVDLDVQLTRAGTPVSTRSIRVEDTQRISIWREGGAARMSEHAERLLDRTLTKALGELFARLREDVQTGASAATADAMQPARAVPPDAEKPADAQTTAEAQEEPLVAAPPQRSLYVDLAAGFVFGAEGLGPELEASLRWMFVPRLGVSAGILAGYDLGPDRGMRIGMVFSGYFGVSDALTLGLGFKGFPQYINSLGGVTVSAVIKRLLIRAAVDVTGFNGVAVDVGYSL